MAKYILYVYNGRYTGKVVGTARNITSARKMAYELVNDFEEYKGIDILDASKDSDISHMRTVASVYPAKFRGIILYSSHTTDKISKLTPNGAVVGFTRDEKYHLYHD